jgi:SAM-dependent methyltransferase
MECTYDVFLSYKSCDSDWVEVLKNALVKAGIKVWLDKDNIRPGDLFVDALEKGLEASKTIIIVVSPEAINSGWVKEEYCRAVVLTVEGEQSRRIIPVLLRNAELPGFLKTRQWVDFRDDDKFKESMRKLIWGIKGEWQDITSLVPEGHVMPLEQIMLQAKESLIVCGHTLDKFAQDINVKKALVAQFAHGTNVTLVLLNPFSRYSQAHEPFHILESHGSARQQILDTIDILKNLFDVCDKPRNFRVLLTNYMPRFRTIIVDEKICYVSIYMYGKDVGTVPDLCIQKTSDGVLYNWFNAISNSLHEMINSSDIVDLIRDGRFNINWVNTKVADAFNHCLESSCCRSSDNRWTTIRRIILGYQNEHSIEEQSPRICSQDYQPGTLTLDKITPEAAFLEPRTTFEDWINNALQDQIISMEKAQLDLFLRMSKDVVAQKVKEALEFRPIGDKSLKHEIWYQEYSDILRRLIALFAIGNPDLDLNIYPNLSVDRADFIFEVLNWLEKFKQPDLRDWLHLSIAAGLLGIDEKPIHAATSIINSSKGIALNLTGKDREVEIHRVGNELWETAKSPCRIDATNVFFHFLETSKRYQRRIVAFSDDYLETIVLLKFYEELLRDFPKLEIDLIPRSIRCGNDATYEDIQSFLVRFSGLKCCSRFRVAETGPKIGGVNLLKLHPEVIRLIDRAFIIDVRGARNYEMMQGINKDAFFGFMVCRQFSESVTGLLAEERPFMYLHQSPGEYSFRGFCLRHKRQEGGRMFAEITVNDCRDKWQGGVLATFDAWPDTRKKRYKILRDFYSNNAPEFHWKYGRDLEPEVKEFLAELSGKVLVIGCGSGKEVRYLSQRGCDTIGIDFSSEAILLAQSEHPNLRGRFLIEDVYNIDNFISGEFDGIVANAVLLHLLEKNDMLDIVKKICGRLKRGGLCFIRLIEKENIEEEVDSHMFGEQRWFVYFSEEELNNIAKANGFLVEKTARFPHKVYPGVYWVSLLLKKAQQDLATIEKPMRKRSRKPKN